MVRLAAALAALWIAGAAGALAQGAYPVRPIRLLVGIPPGGAPDLAARIVGDTLAKRLGQPIVVENRPGVNGNIAADAVAKAQPDGYTLLLGQDSVLTINPALYARMPFDPARDLLPVGPVASNQFVLAVNPKLPVKTLQEFIDYARKADPPLPYASGGNGSQHQLAMEMLRQRSGIRMQHVVYRGGTPAALATVAGDTVALFSGTSSAPLIQSGQLRGLAVTGKTRSAALPDLPRIGELYPGYDVEIWLGLFAPAGTPAPVVERLRAELAATLADPDVKRRLDAAGGLEPMVLAPEAFAALIKSDAARYGKLVAEVGAKVE